MDVVDGSIFEIHPPITDVAHIFNNCHMLQVGQVLRGASFDACPHPILPPPPPLQLMSSSPAAVSILSLKVVRSESAIATAILTLNITNFHPPQDGFVVIYMVRSSAGASLAQHHVDDDIGVSDAGTPTFIDAVTYPGRC
jgi:hypothetical protein